MNNELVVVVLSIEALIAIWVVGYVAYAIWSDKDRDIFIRKKRRQQEE